MSDLQSKPVSASRVSLSQLMQPEHANLMGNVHGGYIMKLVDEVGALACMRHANQRVVTVAVDNLTFRQPIHIGHLVMFTAEVSYTGRTSMEAEVRVVAENPLTGERTFTNTAHLVYVALNEDGKPVPVPQIECENEQQERRKKQAEARQEYRLQQAREVEPSV
ncbi:MAG: acyl-CoA thioesterase [Chloroflexi bacterium]|nr:MAG: acyl-CoA thioesterase [Chloroflexota bacterium]MBL1193524.1 acyl-CoA thioesterase [Chloroflexota bacterium]NOH10815.1 acyl-CoA thioesterase [Chloroflexota bacterium]